MNGAQSLFKALVDAGITTCFANPGTSEMQLVYEIGMTDKVRPVLCLQEDVVTGAADGYAPHDRRAGRSRCCMWAAASPTASPCCTTRAGPIRRIVNVVGANASYHQPNYPEHELIGGRVSDLARTGVVTGRRRRAAPPISASSARRPRRSRRPARSAP